MLVSAARARFYEEHKNCGLLLNVYDGNLCGRNISSCQSSYCSLLFIHIVLL